MYYMWVFITKMWVSLVQKNILDKKSI